MHNLSEYINIQTVYLRSLLVVDQESYLIILIKNFVHSIYTSFIYYDSIEITIYCLFFSLVYLLIYSSSNLFTFSSIKTKKINIFNNLIFILTICVTFYVFQLLQTYQLVLPKIIYSFFIFDFYSNFLGHLIILFFLINLKLSERYSLHNVKLNTIEYPLLLCFSIIFLLLLVAAFDLMSLYLTIEGLSLTLYVLAAYDTTSSGSIEASLKYFCLGAIASSLLGFGISLLYGSIGTLNYFKILYFFSTTHTSIISDYLISLSLSFICFGFFFKLSIPPFHGWTPDVYEGSPTITTFFFSTIVKFGIFCTFIRLVFTFNYAFLENNNSIKIYFICFSLSAILIGSLGALCQNKFKRFLGYTAINQMGFILLGVSCLSFYGFIASLLHLIVYVLMNTIMFWILLSSNYNKRKLIYFSDLRYLMANYPVVSGIFCLTLFSMAGIPPTIGFYTKFLLLKAAMFAGFFTPIALILFISIVSIFYYIRLIKILLITKQTDSLLEIRPIFFFNTLDHNLEVLDNTSSNNIIYSLVYFKQLIIFIMIFMFLLAIGFKTFLQSDFFNYTFSSLWNCFKILDINQCLITHEKFENNIQIFINMF